MARTGRPRTRFVTVGQRFGRGVVIDPEIRTGFTKAVPYGRPGARLRCDCGNAYEAQLVSLFSYKGRAVKRSCGCLHREAALVNGLASRPITHGLSGHALYGTWRQMLQRCENPDHVAYRYYGAKGRSVCKRWRDIRLFVEDIERDLGPRPDGMTLDRIDSDGNYEPGNVRWATAAEQVANSTLTYGERSGKARLTDLVVIECRRRYAAGETQAALAREFGIGAGHMSSVISGRLWPHLPIIPCASSGT